MASQAPDVFQVKFECSNGTFVVECDRSWAPHGADRVHELVEAGFYDAARFFRVVVNPRPFVVQFGLPADPAVAKRWSNAVIPDDPVTQSNSPGTVTFATRGPKTRTTQLFINLGDNSFLDSQGFSPFGRIVEGSDVVTSINGEYGERPDQGRIQSMGNAYLEREFPNMDYIKTATVIV